MPPDPPQQVQDFGALFFRVVTPLYLGTCEDTPLIDFYPAYIPVPVEESGQTYGFDYLYDGQEADIICTLNTWNEGVAAFLMAYAAGSLINRAVARGSDFDGYIGTMMAQEGANVPLTLVFPYAGKPQYGLAGMPAAYRYYSCRLTHNGLRDLSTRPKKILMAWRAQRLLVPGLGTLLYDNILGPGLPFPN